MKLFSFYLAWVLLFILTYSLTYSIGPEGWNHLNLHCRDNGNTPIDWWFLYKPPTEIIPYVRLGRNFTYLTSNGAGKWRPSFSHRNINSNTLLQNTLSPIFRPTYSDHLAIAMYDANVFDQSTLGSKARGVLMADEAGGVWITHTVPDLINLERERPIFPDKETPNGHLVACLSLDLITVNHIARYLTHTMPHLIHVQIPEKLINLLPEWNFDRPPLLAPIKPLVFTTKGKSFRAELWVRRPSDAICLYRAFARSKRIFLDVYGQSESDYLTSVCGQSYGYAV